MRSALRLMINVGPRTKKGARSTKADGESKRARADGEPCASDGRRIGRDLEGRMRCLIPYPGVSSSKSKRNLKVVAAALICKSQGNDNGRVRTERDMDACCNAACPRGTP